MIGQLGFLPKETLTCDKYAVSTHSTRWQEATREDRAARFHRNQQQECLMMTAETLSGQMKMHDSVLGMLSHH